MLAGWFDRLDGKDREAWAGAGFEEALGTGALLLGRRTYEWFVARGWVTRGGGWADRLHAVPKYVDELRLMVCPFALGEGGRLFGRTDALTALRLVEHRTVGDSIVRLTYRPLRDA